MRNPRAAVRRALAKGGSPRVERTVDGQSRKLVTHSARNGFVYTMRGMAPNEHGENGPTATSDPSAVWSALSSCPQANVAPAP
jgi:hypothetical protein